jgi:hypothetical protein
VGKCGVNAGWVSICVWLVYALLLGVKKVLQGHLSANEALNETCGSLPTSADDIEDGAGCHVPTDMMTAGTSPVWRSYIPVVQFSRFRVGGLGEEMYTHLTMYTHVSKCKNDKIFKIPNNVCGISYLWRVKLNLFSS